MITWHIVTLYFSEEGGDIDEAYSDINDSKSGMRDENEEKWNDNFQFYFCLTFVL